METTLDPEVKANETAHGIEIATHLDKIANHPQQVSRYGNSNKRYPKTEDAKRMMDIYNKYYAEMIPGTTTKRTMSINCAPCVPKVVNFFLTLKATPHG